MDEASLNNYGCLAFASCDEGELFSLISDFKTKFDPFNETRLKDRQYLQKVLHFVRDRGEKFAHLSDFTGEVIGYFYNSPSSPVKILERFDANLASKLLIDLVNMNEWNLEKWKEIAQNNNVDSSKFFLLFRLSVSDSYSGPPLKDLVSFFGKDECVRRLNYVIKMLSNN